MRVLRLLRGGARRGERSGVPLRQHGRVLVTQRGLDGALGDALLEEGGAQRVDVRRVLERVLPPHLDRLAPPSREALVVLPELVEQRVRRRGEQRRHHDDGVRRRQALHHAARHEQRVFHVLRGAGAVTARHADDAGDDVRRHEDARVRQHPRADHEVHDDGPRHQRGRRPRDAGVVRGRPPVEANEQDLVHPERDEEEARGERQQQRHAGAVAERHPNGHHGLRVAVGEVELGAQVQMLKVRLRYLSRKRSVARAASVPTAPHLQHQRAPKGEEVRGQDVGHHRQHDRHAHRRVPLGVEVVERAALQQAACGHAGDAGVDERDQEARVHQLHAEQLAHAREHVLGPRVRALQRHHLVHEHAQQQVDDDNEEGEHAGEARRDELVVGPRGAPRRLADELRRDGEARVVEANRSRRRRAVLLGKGVAVAAEAPRFADVRVEEVEQLVHHHRALVEHVTGQRVAVQPLLRRQHAALRVLDGEEHQRRREHEREAHEPRQHATHPPRAASVLQVLPDDSTRVGCPPHVQAAAAEAQPQRLEDARVRRVLLHGAVEALAVGEGDVRAHRRLLGVALQVVDEPILLLDRRHAVVHGRQAARRHLAQVQLRHVLDGAVALQHQPLLLQLQHAEHLAALLEGRDQLRVSHAEVDVCHAHVVRLARPRRLGVGQHALKVLAQAPVQALQVAVLGD
mmetsp:Transcript_24740/g.86113  ORF Transcript_24740/g.86113 Transcript_24740/m.86113 type:complete len:687 (-) Transcript_24740:1911-3971(-)